MTDDPRDIRKPDWLDRSAAERPFLREPYAVLKARGAFDFTDSPEDVERAGNRQCSTAEQEWHDYRHDVLSDYLERPRPAPSAPVKPAPEKRPVDPAVDPIEAGLAVVRYENVFGRRPDPAKARRPDGA